MAGERLMTLAELAELLGVPVGTLYGWRHQGEGPPGYRIGRHVRYRRSAVEGLGSRIRPTGERPDGLDRAARSAAARQVRTCADGDAVQGPLSRLGREAAQRDQTPSGRGRAA